MQRSATLLFVASCWVIYSLVLAGSALAQDQYDCASFGSQEAAQAELDRDPSDPSDLDADDDGVACETYPYSGSGDGGGGGDLDCAAFDTHGAAQSELANDPSDPNNLDGDNDGIACEELIGSGGADEDQYAKEPPAEVDTPKGVVPDTVTVKKVPDTGGPPYL